ncbi:MAG: aminotransferase class V-fold PLP-dependent enzyme [Eubacterium sp.]|nr:aminotransferase class V-fold PLP-dependent enzyme [Eubacterium sp.]
MIYFDNAATTYPKPACVIKSAERALYDYGANPGRSGHRLSVLTSEQVFYARERCAEFFGAETENTVFTLNCTHALNFAIKGVCALYKRPHIITTDLEHNAVIRPIHSLAKQGMATYSIADSGETDDDLIRSVKRLIRRETRIMVVTAGCNVDGRITPLARLAEICHARGICLIADCAQAAGVIPISLSDGINVICAPGHKGLYGPMGTGLLLTDGKYPLSSIIEGGTGSNSEDVNQPDFLPDMLESGTINTPGAIALGSGVAFVKSKGIHRISQHETAICERIIEGLSGNPRITVYRSANTARYLPVVSFNVNGISSAEVAQILSDNGFYLRAGLHCNFLAHKKLGTIKYGTVRLAPSVFNTMSDAVKFISFINKNYR